MCRGVAHQVSCQEMEESCSAGKSSLLEQVSTLQKEADDSGSSYKKQLSLKDIQIDSLEEAVSGAETDTDVCKVSTLNLCYE